MGIFTRLSNLWGAVTNPAATAATVGQQAAAAAVQEFHHVIQGPERSTIDDHIEFLWELTLERDFPKAGGQSAGLSKDEAPLEDFIERLETIERESNKLFGVDLTSQNPLIAKDKLVFNSLKKELQLAIQHAQQEEAPSSIKLSANAKKAAHKVVCKLRELKLKNKDPATNTKLSFTTAPEIGHLVLSLAEAQQSLSKQNLNQINLHLKKLKDQLDVVLQYQKDIFIVKKLDRNHLQTFTSLQALIQNYSNIPDSLKYTRLLQPTETKLLQQMNQLTSLIPDYITEDKGLINQLSEKLKNSIQTTISENLPTLSNNSNVYHSPFDKLHDAIDYFINHGQQLAANEKRKILKSLIELCEPQFKEHFLATIGKTNPHPPAEPNHDYAINYLGTGKLEVLKGAFKSSMIDLAKRNRWNTEDPIKNLLVKARSTSIPHSKTNTATIPALHNPLMEYVNAALTYLQGNKSLTHSFAPAIGKTFIQLLESETITKWIDSQGDATCKAEMQTLKNTTIQALKNASSGDHYVNAFTSFKETINSKHWILDLFEFPTLFEDSKTTEAQTAAVDELSDTMSSLRKDLDKAKAKQEIDFPWNDAAKADARIKQQLQTLTANVQDQLTYQLIYHVILRRPSDDSTVFYNIKKLQANESKEAARKKIFLQELKQAINNSGASWFFKTTAKLLIWCGIYGFIGKHALDIVNNLHTNINSRIDNLDKKSLLTRASHCFSKYNALLKNWAFAPSGGDKIPSMNMLMQGKEYLEYNNKSYTQSELYQTVSSKLVNQYVQLSSGEESWLDVKMHQLGSAIFHRPLYPRNKVASSLNWLWIGFKAILIGLPGYTLLGVGKLIGTPCYWIANNCLRICTRKVISHNQVLENLVLSTRQNVYEDNPYVYVVTSFVADQLEMLSKELDKKTGDFDTTSNQATSDSVRDDIRKTLLHLFEVLDKNKFKTQEQLQQHLKNESLLKRADTWVDGKLLTPTIEALIELAVTISGKMLNKQALQQPFSLLLDQLNQILTEPPNTTMTETEKLKQKAVEEKMHKYTNKVLRQVIESAVDIQFNNFGEQEVKYANKILTEIKEKTAKLMNEWKPVLQGIGDYPDHKARYNALTDLIHKSDTFLAEIQDQYSLLSNRECRTSKEVGQQLLTLITPFKNFLAGTGQQGGLLTLYSNYNNLYKETNDLPYISTCLRSHQTIQRGLEDLKDRISDKKLKQMISSNADLFYQTLSELTSGKLALLKELDSYEAILTILKENDGAYLKEHVREMQYIQGTLIPNFTAIDAVGNPPDFFNTIERIKRNHLTNAGGAWKIARFFGVDADSKRWKEFYHSISTSIEQIPNLETRTSLLEAVKKIHDTTSLSDLPQQVQAFQKLWNDYVLAEKEKLGQATKKLETIHGPIITHLGKLQQSFQDSISSKSKDNEALHTGLEEAMAPLQEAAKNLKTLSFTKATIGLTKTLKKWPSEFTYAKMKPKMDGVVELMRQGGFAQFLANHLLFMPLAEK